MSWLETPPVPAFLLRWALTVSLPACLSVFQLMAAYTKQQDPASMTSATR